MENYYYKLVCVDETNPLEYEILEDKNVDSLDDVHEFVVEHIKDYQPDKTKWILLPFKKENVKVNSVK